VEKSGFNGQMFWDQIEKVFNVTYEDNELFSMEKLDPIN
jgi:hypothetical protein